MSTLLFAVLVVTLIGGVVGIVAIGSVVQPTPVTRASPRQDDDLLPESQ